MTIPWHQLPNAITVLRILLVGPIVYLLAKESYSQALWLFLVAGISDALDGFLARAFRWFSRFGAICDPLADKALLVAVYIVLTYNGLLPLWLLVVVFGRDLLILTGALSFHMVIGAYTMQPSIWGKLSTFTQITYALVVILTQAGLSMPSWAVPWGLWLVALTSLISGGHYVAVWGHKFWLALKQKNQG